MRKVSLNHLTHLRECAIQGGIRTQLLSGGRRLSDALHRGGLEGARQEEVQVDQEGQLVPAGSGRN